MRFGLQLDMYPREGDGNSYDALLAVTRLAEDVGFASVWYEDHFMWPDVPVGSPAPQLECLTTLAALAGATTRIELGMLVLGAPYRNPALTAKMLTTLDVISHGRIIAGLGAGWHEREFAAYGWPFPTAAERLDRLEETVQIVDAMLRDSPASFAGRYHAIERALNDPPPIRQPRPPILIGGNGERRTLRLVARYADLCNVYGGVEEVAHRFDVLRGHCAAVGRPYEAITRTINYWALTADNDAERAAKAARFPRAAIETTEELIANLRRYEAVGTQYVIIKILDADRLTPLRQFAEIVMPAFA